MKKIKISFSPLFIIFAFLVVYFSWIKQFAVYILVLLLHELAHYVVARLYGYKLNKIIFMPYGAGLSGENNVFKPSHEIVIALAGPLVNMFFVVVFVALWWLVPVTFFYTYLFVIINLVVGVFNLLPIFPLDGGRIIIAYFSKNYSKLKLYKIMKIIGISFSVLFAIFFVVSAFSVINVNWFFMSAFLFTSSFGNVKDVYYQRVHVASLKNKGYEKPLEIKSYIVNKDTNIAKLLKHIKGNNFTQFLFVDENLKVVKVLNEKEIYEAYYLK